MARMPMSGSTTQKLNVSNLQAALLWCAIIDAASNNVPTAIDISEVTSPYGTSCSQGKLQNILVHQELPR